MSERKSLCGILETTKHVNFRKLQESKQLAHHGLLSFPSQNLQCCAGSFGTTFFLWKLAEFVYYPTQHK